VARRRYTLRPLRLLGECGRDAEPGLSPSSHLAILEMLVPRRHGGRVSVRDDEARRIVAVSCPPESSPRAVFSQRSSTGQGNGALNHPKIVMIQISARWRALLPDHGDGEGDDLRKALDRGPGGQAAARGVTAPGLRRPPVCPAPGSFHRRIPARERADRPAAGSQLATSLAKVDPAGKPESSRAGDGLAGQSWQRGDMAPEQIECPARRTRVDVYAVRASLEMSGGGPVRRYEAALRGESATRRSSDPGPLPVATAARLQQVRALRRGTGTG